MEDLPTPNFDPVGEILNAIQVSGLSIEEVAVKCGIKGPALRKSLNRDPNFKLGLEDSLKICVALGDDSFVSKWAKSHGMGTVKRPPPMNVSIDPVVHVRSSNLALATFMMLVSMSTDVSDTKSLSWLAKILNLYADCMKSALLLSDKPYVSQNEMKEHNYLWSTFLSHKSNYPLPQRFTPILSHAISDFSAANNALMTKLRPYP